MSLAALANPAVTVNNVAVAIVPNSVTFTEGFGEQVVRAASAGGGSVQQVFSKNIESNFATVKFSVYPDPETVDQIRAWKAADNTNLVAITGTVTAQGVEKTLKRTFKNATLINDYEVALGADTTIELEFKSDQAV